MRFRGIDKHKLKIYYTILCKSSTTPSLFKFQKQLRSSRPLRLGQNKNEKGAQYFQATYQRHPVYQKALSGLQATKRLNLTKRQNIRENESERESKSVQTLMEMRKDRNFDLFFGLVTKSANTITFISAPIAPRKCKRPKYDILQYLEGFGRESEKSEPYYPETPKLITSRSFMKPSMC